jgi:hypothetical protein
MRDRDGDGSGELIALIPTITDPAAASAQELAQAHCQRREEETGNDQLKTHLRGPGAVLRPKSPDMVRREIYGYLLTHYAIAELICRAATEADIDPDRVKFLRTVRIIRRRTADPAFSPRPGPAIRCRGHGRRHPPAQPQPSPAAPLLPPRAAQLLQGQTARRHRSGPRHDQRPW